MVTPAKLIWRLRAVIRPPITLGASCLVVDARDHVLLVRHTYKRGWHLPGGGVEIGESTRTAAMREVSEETGLRLVEPPAFFGLYFNRALYARDHVALFVARIASAIDPASLVAQPTEIAEVTLKPRDTLPEGTTLAVRARIAEVLDGAAIREEW